MLYSGSPLGRDKTVYVADFGRQRDTTAGRKIFREVAQQVWDCLPDKRAIDERKYCRIMEHHKKQDLAPIKFITFLSIGNEVELYMYRGFHTDISTYQCDRGVSFVLHHDWTWIDP